MPITLNGDSNNNELTFDSTTFVDVVATGGLGQDTINIGTESETSSIQNVTVFGGEGVTSPSDDDDTINVSAETALIYGNGGDDSVSVSVDDGATVFGGAGIDSIFVGSDGSDGVSVAGGNNTDIIQVIAPDSDVTVFGGNGVTDTGDDADFIQVFGETALVYGNAGNDSINVTVEDGASVYGGQGSDQIFIEVEGVTATGDVLAFGGANQDTIIVDAEQSDVTVYGGAGVTDAADGNDTITVISAETALIYGNGGQDSIDVSVEDGASIFGGAGADTIGLTVTGETDAAVEVYGGNDRDAITLTSDGTGEDSDVLVYGGNGVSDSGDGADTIAVGASGDTFEDATVYGNGGNDLIDVFVSESANVFGGSGNDTINVTQVSDETAGTGPNANSIQVLGGVGQDVIDVVTDLDNVTVSGGGSLTAAQSNGGSASAGDDLSIEHNDGLMGGASISTFTFIGSTGNDSFTFEGLDNDAVRIISGGGDDGVSIDGESSVAPLEFDIEDNTVDFADLAGATVVSGANGNVTFTYDEVDVTLVGVTLVNGPTSLS